MTDPRQAAREALENAGWVPVDQVPEEWKDGRVLEGWCRFHENYGYTSEEIRQHAVRWERYRQPARWVSAAPTPNYFAGLTVLFVKARHTPTTPDPLAEHLRAALEREEALREALAHYGKEMCEGLCSEYGPNFDDDVCFGCRARALIGGGHE